MPKPLKPEEVWRRLSRHDQRFSLLVNRGKGSHRMIFHPDVSGKLASFPLPWHRGTDCGIGLLRALIRRFNLPNDIFGR